MTTNFEMTDRRPKVVPRVAADFVWLLEITTSHRKKDVTNSQYATINSLFPTDIMQD